MFPHGRNVTNVKSALPLNGASTVHRIILHIEQFFRASAATVHEDPPLSLGGIVILAVYFAQLRRVCKLRYPWHESGNAAALGPRLRVYIFEHPLPLPCVDRIRAAMQICGGYVSDINRFSM